MLTHPSTYVLCTGTDEKAIINVLAYRSNAQRVEINLKFKSMYGKVSQLYVRMYVAVQFSTRLFTYVLHVVFSLVHWRVLVPMGMDNCGSLDML